MRKKNIYLLMILSLVVTISVGCGKQSDAVFVSADGSVVMSEEDSDVANKDLGAISDVAGKDLGETSAATDKVSREASDKNQLTETGEGRDAQENATDSVKTAGSDSEADYKETEPAICYVHVCGAVKHPGVYQLKSGSRVYEAIQMAGGTTGEAYEAGLNQALVIADGDRIVVPTIEEWEAGIYQENITDSGGDGSATSQNSSTGEGLVNINTATREELCTLSGIGETRADAIISYREQNGNFSSIEEIQNVSGIKEGLYEKIKDKITVS